MNPLIENTLVVLIVGGAAVFLARRFLGKLAGRRGRPARAAGRGLGTVTEEGCASCPGAKSPGGGCAGCG